MSIQSNFNKSITGVNFVYGDIISKDNISCKKLTCSNEIQSDDLTCNGGLTCMGNLTTNLTSTYQKKALISTTGNITTKIPSWTSNTLTDVSGITSTLDFDTFIFDTNFKVNTIRFQGKLSNNPSSNPSCQICGLKSGVKNTGLMDNNVIQIQRSATLGTIDITNNLRCYVEVMSNMFNSSVPTQFEGTLSLNAILSNGSFNMSVDCLYTQQSTTVVRSIGSARFSTNYNGINGLRFKFTNIPNNASVFFQYYVESK